MDLVQNQAGLVASISVSSCEPCTVYPVGHVLLMAFIFSDSHSFFLTFFCQIPGAPGGDRVMDLMDTSSLDSLCITSVCESWHPLLSAAGRRYLSRSIADYHCEACP